MSHVSPVRGHSPKSGSDSDSTSGLCNMQTGVATIFRPGMVTRSMTAASKTEQQKNAHEEQKKHQQATQEKLSEKVGTTLDLITAIIHHRAAQAAKKHEAETSGFDAVREEMDVNLSEVTDMIIGRMGEQ